MLSYIAALKFPIVIMLAYVVAGGCKFLVSAVREKSISLKLIGLGGFPSNHSTIVSSVTTLTLLTEGMDTGAFGACLALTTIVVIDALDLRRQIGKHAMNINALLRARGLGNQQMRERIGHSRLEVAGGLLLGALIANTFHFSLGIFQ